MVDAAVPLIDIIWRDLTARFNLRDPDQRAALSAEIKRLLATIKNSDVREAYATALRELYRGGGRSEEHTSELPSLMRTSYPVFCLKKNTHISLKPRNPGDKISHIHRAN